MNLILYQPYNCLCGRSFRNRQSYVAHSGHCKVHMMFYHGITPKSRNHGESPLKGKTKDDPIYGELIRRFSEAGRLAQSVNPLVIWNINKNPDSYINQSNTRKEKYRTGELVPAKGVGRGKYSYIIHDGNKIMLRSTYEFLYALYLIKLGIPVEYESIRATFNDHTYISDFKIGNKIIEVKGNYHFDYSEQKKAFESLGFEYEVVMWDKIIEIKEYLKNFYDVDDLINKICEGHDSRNYFEFSC